MPVDLARVYPRRVGVRRLFRSQALPRHLLVALLSAWSPEAPGRDSAVIPVALQRWVTGNLTFFDKVPSEGRGPAAARLGTRSEAGTGEDGEDRPHWYIRAQRVAERFDFPLETADGRISWQFLALSFLAYPIIVFLRVAMLFANHYCLRWTGARVVRDLRNDLFDHLQRQSLKFFSQVEVGQLISRCTTDTLTIELLMSSTVADALRAPFEILGAAAFIVFFAIEQKMVSVLLIAVVVLPLCLVPLLKLGQRVRKWSRRNMERMSVITQRMHENLTGIRVVKAYHSEAYESARFHEVNRPQLKTLMRGTRADC